MARFSFFKIGNKSGAIGIRHDPHYCSQTAFPQTTRITITNSHYNHQSALQLPIRNYWHYYTITDIIITNPHYHYKSALQLATRITITNSHYNCRFAPNPTSRTLAGQIIHWTARARPKSPIDRDDASLINLPNLHSTPLNYISDNSLNWIWKPKTLHYTLW